MAIHTITCYYNTIICVLKKLENTKIDKINQSTYVKNLDRVGHNLIGITAYQCSG